MCTFGGLSKLPFQGHKEDWTIQVCNWSSLLKCTIPIHREIDFPLVNVVGTKPVKVRLQSLSLTLYMNWVH